MRRCSWFVSASMSILLAGGCDTSSNAEPPVPPLPPVPGMWGTTDTSRDLSFVDCASPFVFNEHKVCWAGAKDPRAQWFKILASYVDPTNDSMWNVPEHAKGEPPANTYYLWHYDKPMPEGTKILIEGDFPHCAYFNIGFASPTDAVPFPPPTGWRAVRGDGAGLPEIIFADQDIVPDPGSVNPFVPGAPRDAKNRHYHVTFELKNGDPATINTFEGANAAVMPNRAPGNLRYGGTFKYNGSSNKIDPATGKPYGYRGPYMWIRVHLPDRFDPFGGVAPPIVRIQFPGQAPVLAPISREMELNEGKLLDPYPIEENPALGDSMGRSKLENMASDALSRAAVDALDAAGVTPPAQNAWIRKAFTIDGQLDFLKNMNTSYYVSFFVPYANWRNGLYTDEQIATWATSTLPKRYLDAYGMNASQPQPMSTQSSGHNVQTSYLTSKATLDKGEVLVITGRMPKVPRTQQGAAAPMPADDELRYLNLTLQGGAGAEGREGLALTAVGDLSFEDVVLDQGDKYMIVVGRPEDRPAMATQDRGVTWRNWVLGSSLSVYWRLTASSKTPWVHSLHNVTWGAYDYANGSPAGTASMQRDAIRKTMAEYYPVARYMTRAELDAMLAGGTTGLSLPARAPTVIDPPTGRGNITVGISQGGTSPRWRLDYGPWRAAGQSFAASVGRHLLSFEPVKGFATPHPRYVEVPAEGVTVAETYRAGGGGWKGGPCANAYCYADKGLENIVADGAGGLYALGKFSRIDGVSANRVARWDGSKWNALAGGVNETPEAAAIFNGGLVVGGYFTDPGRHLAYWKNGAWAALPGTNAPVRSLAVVGTALFAGGMFTEGSNGPASHIAEWDPAGQRWKALGGGVDGNVYAITSYGGKVVAAGDFRRAGDSPAANVALWDGVRWSPLGVGVDAPVYGLVEHAGRLYATGDFEHSGGQSTLHIAAWDGSGWGDVGGGLDGLGKAYGRTLAVWNGRLVVGGNFTRAGTTSARRIAAWNGDAWSPIGNGFSSWVEGLAVHGTQLVACGWFNNIYEDGGPVGIGVFVPDTP